MVGVISNKATEFIVYAMARDDEPAPTEVDEHRIGLRIGWIVFSRIVDINVNLAVPAARNNGHGSIWLGLLLGIDLGEQPS